MTRQTSKATTALVVEDSPTFRFILASILKRNHLKVYEAEDGEDALDVLSTIFDPIDVIFLDWHMPKLNGGQLLHALRQDPRYQRTKFVVVTSQSSIVSLCDVLDAGAHQVITKPFTDDTIENVLWMEHQP